jgi:hypothetical protein
MNVCCTVTSDSSLPAPIRMMHSSRGAVFTSPKWTVEGVSGHEKIVLHVSVLQAGEDLMMLRLGYSVTAAGYLRTLLLLSGSASKSWAQIPMIVLVVPSSTKDLRAASGLSFCSLRERTVLRTVCYWHLMDHS